jgi:dTMP kinase
VEHEEYSGKLIVVEGTDGVGRSTHIALLRTWLESRGHAVLESKKQKQDTLSGV